MKDLTESMYTLFVQGKLKDGKEISNEELRKYFDNSYLMINEYLELRRKSYKKDLKDMKRKLIMSKLKREKKIDYLSFSIKSSTELNDKFMSSCKTLLDYGKYSYEKPTIDSLRIYNAYKEYCSSIGEISDRLSSDILNNHNNRLLLSCVLETEDKINEIEEKNKDLKDHVQQIVELDKTNKKVLKK